MRTTFRYLLVLWMLALQTKNWGQFLVNLENLLTWKYLRGSVVDSFSMPPGIISHMCLSPWIQNHARSCVAHFIIVFDICFRASAEHALLNLNGTQLGGQSIRLSWGRSPNNQVCFFFYHNKLRVIWNKNIIMFKNFTGTASSSSMEWWWWILWIPSTAAGLWTIWSWSSSSSGS